MHSTGPVAPKILPISVRRVIAFPFLYCLNAVDDCPFHRKICTSRVASSSLARTVNLRALECIDGVRNSFALRKKYFMDSYNNLF